MTDRTCGWCGADISHMRSNAKYCCLQHKKNAGSKRHRARNPGYYSQYTRSPARIAWSGANREQILAYAREQQRQYRIDHPGAARAWWVANREKHRLYQANRRASKKAGACLVTERDINRLLGRFDNRCAYCGTGDRQLHLDHVVPLKLGGRHTIGNLLPACQPCNSSKNASLLMAWKRRRWNTQWLVVSK